jgi:hypothetical protein
MTHDRNEQAAILILRAWREHDGLSGLRVRATRVIGRQALPIASASTVDGACAMVREWLDGLTPGSTGQRRPTRHPQ